MTNLEGRVSAAPPCARPPADVRTDLEMLVDLAAGWAAERWFPTAAPREVFDELRRASAAASPTTPGSPTSGSTRRTASSGRVPASTIQARRGCSSTDFPTPSGRARFHAVEHQLPAEDRDGDYPLYLTTGRVLAHYQSGTQTRRVAALQALAPEPFAEMHPLTARRLGVETTASSR